MKIKDLWITDLIQAKLLKSNRKISTLEMFRFLVKYRTARIHYFIRLRSSQHLFLRIISKIFLDRFMIEIGTKTVIGQYFWLPHPRCIIIADHVVIGEHVHIGQYVTIGGNFKKIKELENGKFQKLPILGNRINVHPGAVIGGPVTINNDVIIGANSVVTRDVPANTMVFGQNQFAAKKVKLPAEGGYYEIL